MTTDPFEPSQEEADRALSALARGLTAPDPEKTRGRGSQGAKKATGYSRAAMIGRAIELITDGEGPLPAGGFYWKCEHKITVYGGMQKTKDILGFMDAQGVGPNGEWVAIQVTSAEKVASHLRDYTNEEKTTGTGKVPILYGLRKFLSLGGLLWIAGYEKYKGRYQWSWSPITEADLQAAIGRKRKK